jgi:hypothetical protein
MRLDAGGFSSEKKINCHFEQALNLEPEYPSHKPRPASVQAIPYIPIKGSAHYGQPRIDESLEAHFATVLIG